jgi:hypothetical protein
MLENHIKRYTLLKIYFLFDLGTLRNLKKVEQALEMMNKMLDTDSESN